MDDSLISVRRFENDKPLGLKLVDDIHPDQCLVFDHQHSNLLCHLTPHCVSGIDNAS